MAFNIGLTITANNTSGRAFSRLNNNLKKTETNARKTSKALKGLRLAIGLIAVGALVNFGKNLTETTGKLQLMLIRLGNVEGGAKKAKVTFDRLFKTFGSSPFTIDAVTDSLIRLRAAGVESGLAERAVTAGADAIAAFGGTSEELKRFSIGLQQVAGKGVLSMEELRQQIGEALPVAMRVFATQTGRSISEVISDVEKGKISAGEFLEALTTGLEQTFGGFSQKLGDTVLGSIQGAKSKIQKAIADTFLGNTDVAARLALIIQNVSSEIANFINSLTQKDVIDFFQTLKNGADILLGLGKTLVVVAKAVFDFFNFLSNLANTETLAAVGGAGVIGFMLFGPLGAVAGVVAGLLAVGGGVDDLRKKVSAPLDPGENTLFNRLLNFSVFADGDMQQQFDKAKKTFEDFQKAANTTSNLGGSSTLADKLIGSQADLDRIKKNLADVADGAKALPPAIQGLGQSSQKAQKQLEGLFERSAASVAGAETFPFVKTAETALNRLDKIIEGFEGDRKIVAKLSNTANLTKEQSAQLTALGREFVRVDGVISKVQANIAKAKGIGFAKELVKANVATDRIIASFKELVGGVSDLEIAQQKVTKEFAKQEADLNKALQVQLRLTKAGGFETQGVKDLREQLARVSAERQKALAFAERQVRIAQQQLEIETRLSGLTAQDTITNLQRETRGAFGTIFSSDSADQAESRRNELKRQALETESQLIDLRERARVASENGNTATEAALNKQIEALGRVKAAQMEALQQTTAMAIAAREMWMSVRDAMTGAAEEGLLALVRGTKSWKEIATNAFNQMQEAAARFLIELIKIRLQKALIASFDSGSGGGGGGGGFLGQLGGFATSFFGGSANGNAFKGGIKPFEKGGIIGGPTLFGLAGEAGDEAIMPLTRIGGKLGVQTTGGAGGDTFAITVQAIDTQTGVEFIRKNSSSIINTMRQANGLNKGIGNVR